MSGWILGAASLVGTGAGIWSSSSAAGATRRSAASAFRNRPFESSDPLQQLYAQAAYGIGSDPDQLTLDLMVQQLGEVNRESVARGLQDHFGKWKQLAALDTSKMSPQEALKHADRIKSQRNFVEKYLRDHGLGTVSMVDGLPRLVSSDPAIQQTVEAARANGATIRSNRLAAEQNLAKLAVDFPTATAAELDALTGTVRQSQEREINERMRLQSDQLLQQANLRGFNPAGVIGELEKNRSDALFDTQFTSADRALQILTGRQAGAAGSIAGINSALSPDRFLSLLTGQRGGQDNGASIGQLAAAQMAASQQRAQGIQQAGSGLSDTLSLIGLLNMNSSQKTNKGPGADDGGLSSIMANLYNQTGN